MDALETGKRIQELRKNRGWTQKELAERLCVSDKAVSKWERGLNFPDMAMLEPLANELDTTVVELLGIEDASESEKVGSVTALSVEETTRLKKEIRERALTCLVVGVVVIVSQITLSVILHHNGLYGLPQILSLGMMSFSGLLIGNSLWIWWHHRK